MIEYPQAPQERWDAPANVCLPFVETETALYPGSYLLTVGKDEH